MASGSPFIYQWVLEHGEHRPDAPAISTPAVRLSYGELAGRVRALAAHLAARGVLAGDRVLVALPNVPAAVVAPLAVQLLGATAVEVNREWAPDTLGAIIAQAGVRHAIVLGRDARVWGRVLAGREGPGLAGGPLTQLWVVHGSAGGTGSTGTTLPGRMRADLGVPEAALILEDGRVDPALGEAPAAHPVSPPPDAPALILYTSGSTGQPRGVVQTHRNVAANTRSIVAYLELGADDRALLVLPLYYCYGRSVLQTHLHAGASVFLDPRFAFPRTVLEALGAEGCTGFAGVPLTFEIIRRQVDVGTLTFPRLRYLTQAGGAMAPETIAWVRRAFHPARLFVMYGQTEATARLSYLPPAEAERKRGSIGLAIPGVELQVVDERGVELPRGETGHLVARGENVTPGYLGEPAETAAILHDGWLWTGDLALRDEDGFFFHRGRSKEILKVGGHRVSPVEIEQVVAEHPDVAEAAVVGVPDALMGDAPVAFVVPRTGAAPTAEALKAFCRGRMPAYRVPVRFALVGALPRNEAGKLLRAELARQAAEPGG